MKLSLSKENDSISLMGIIHSIIFFGVYYLYIWLFVNPALYYQQQQPVFLIDRRFFDEFLSYPGGLTKYFDAFISQFYIFPWIGALFIVGIVWLITLCTSAIIKSVTTKKEIIFIKYFPALLLLSLHSYYDFALSVDIGLLVALLFTVLYLRLNPENKYIRIILSLLYMIITFHIAAGSMVLFAIICLLYELIHKRNLLNAFMYLFIGLIVLYLAPFFFLIPAKDVFLNLITFKDNLSPDIIQYILFLFYPVAFMYYLYASSPEQKTDKGNTIINKILNLSNNRILLILQPVILIILIIGIACFAGNKDNKSLLQIEYYAHNKEWNKVLDCAKDKVNNNILIAFQLNRALYHLGTLPDSMFAFSQVWGENGLILPSSVSHIYPLKRSDLFFEMGHLNEAEHMAHEALAVNENFPWIIQRLALLNILKGNEQAASNCLSLLDKTVFYKNWSAKYKDYIGNKWILAKDKYLSTIKSNAPHSDFIMDTNNPFNDVAAILNQKNQNKMAFEYLMMYYLLKGDLNKFIENIDKMDTFGYKLIPRHFEEAMILYKALGYPKQFRIQSAHSDQTTLPRFREFQQIIAMHNGNKISAQKDLKKKFKNSYWYYLLYAKK
ncbi:MAG: hypothetical protein JW956_07065 [Calditrichaceae bacterium]|nr:hypothetical protein [Calditrichaceae bacterium]